MTLKKAMFWVRIIAIVAAIVLPAYLTHIKNATRAEAQPLPCAASTECEVRGVDEWEHCHHVKDPPTPPQEILPQPQRDATSKTQDGFACLCIASACRWADKQAQACENTGGHYRPRDICPPCPPNAICEACFVGCQCPPGKSYDKTTGCQ